MIMVTSYNKSWMLVCLLFLTSSSFAQEINNDNNWDNQLHLASKATWGSYRWKYSGELQLRLEDNMQSFQKVYTEGVARFLYSESIEFIPDFRITLEPDETVFRPGLGLLYKLYINDFQFVNLLKWQIDIHLNEGHSDNALRYVLSINKQLNDKLIGTFLAGALYRWSDDFQGVELIRTGPGLSYIFNRKYSLFINYYLNVENNHQDWEWSGIPFIQLIINLDKNYKFLPEK